MDILRAARDGNIQAYWMHAVFLRVVRTTQPAHLIIPFAAFHFTNPPHSSPPTSKYPQAEVVCPSIDCRVFGHAHPHSVSLISTHASTQRVQALLDEGVCSFDHKNVMVRICAAKGSVSIHIRLVCIAAPLAM